MKITVERDALAPALNAAFACVPKKSPIQVLECFRLTAHNQSLRIFANNQDASLAVTIPAEVTQAGDVAVKAETLRNIVHNSSQGAQAVIEVAEDRATLRISRSRYSLTVLPAGEFPEGRSIAEGDPVTRIRIGPKDVPQLFKRARPFVPDLNRYPVYGGIWLNIHDGRLWGFGTNGYQVLAASVAAEPGVITGEPLAFQGVTGETRQGVLIPVEIADGLAQALAGGGEIVTNGRTIIAEASNVTFAAGLLANQFPEAWRYIPRPAANRVTLDRDELSSALKRIATLETEETHLLLHAEPGADTLTMRLLRCSVGEGEEVIRCSSEVAELFVGAFQIKLMTQIIAGLSGDLVSISGTNNTYRIEDGGDATVVAAIWGCASRTVDEIVAGAKTEEPADA